MFDALLRPAVLVTALPLAAATLALAVLLPGLGVASATARVTLALLATVVLTVGVRVALPGWQRPSIWGRAAAGRFGRAVFGLVGLGLRPPPHTAPAPAPTEVLLGRALEVLFEGLPEGNRAQLADLLTVVHRLAARAQALRGGGDADRGRLGEAVTALEHLRLDLLQLRAGDGSVEQLAADLHAARRVAQA